MPATRSRYILLYFACALSVITYIDRVCIGSSAPAIRAELGLTAVQMGWVFSAFTLAYAVFEIPSGWLGDVLGPRKTLMRIVLWWSAFTTASGIAWNFPSLLVARFLFGAGEAGAYPNMSRSFSRWFPSTERGGAHGAVFMSSRLGGAIAPPLVILIISAAGWRASFWIFGLFGIVWSVFWWHWFRDDPATHPSVSSEELAVIRAGTPPTALVRVHWRDLLDVNLLCICTMVLLHRIRSVFLSHLAADVFQGSARVQHQAGRVAVGRRAPHRSGGGDGGRMADRQADRAPWFEGRPLDRRHCDAAERAVHPVSGVHLSPDRRSRIDRACRWICRSLSVRAGRCATTSVAKRQARSRGQ